MLTPVATACSKKAQLSRLGVGPMLDESLLKRKKTALGLPTKLLPGSVRFMLLNMKENFWMHLHAQS